MPDRIIEVGNAGAGIPGCLGVLEEPFEKEDMSEMFRRAFLEKMNVDEPDLPNYHCTCSSHVFTNPEFYICDCFFDEKIVFFFDKNYSNIGIL